jgi:uncharacterized protein with ATP-grasp and redox domains
MKVSPECIPCVVKQTRNTLAYRGADARTTEVALAEVEAWLAHADWDQTPADLSNIAYRTVEKLLPGDPYAEIKRRQNQEALAFLPRLREIARAAADPLAAAVRIAATGNVIDLGIGVRFDIEEEVHKVTDVILPFDHTAKLRQLLARPGRVLYIGDNAGEIVFDLVLVEELARRHSVTFVVRGGPVINDATTEDAQAVGIDAVAEVITTGSNCIGAPWAHASDQFRRSYLEADVVISKGQGNFETLCSRRDKDIIFILRAKCEVIARRLGVGLLDLVVKHNRS